LITCVARLDRRIWTNFPKWRRVNPHRKGWDEEKSEKNSPGAQLGGGTVIYIFIYRREEDCQQLVTEQERFVWPADRGMKHTDTGKGRGWTEWRSTLLAGFSAGSQRLRAPSFLLKLNFQPNPLLRMPPVPTFSICESSSNMLNVFKCSALSSPLSSKSCFWFQIESVAFIWGF